MRGRKVDRTGRNPSETIGSPAAPSPPAAPALSPSTAVPMPTLPPSTAVPQVPTIPAALPQMAPPSPEMARANEILREMMTIMLRLAFKVAICDCRTREKCDLFKLGRQIAGKLDELQSIRGLGTLGEAGGGGEGGGEGASAA